MNLIRFAVILTIFWGIAALFAGAALMAAHVCWTTSNLC